jgi:hypothetical protein
MKKTITALFAGILVFATVYGFAASLSVTSDSLGAGTSAVAACQSTAVNVTYASTYNSSVPGYEATTVTVTGLDETAPKCGGKAIRVTLTGPGASNASLGEQTATLATGAGTTQAFTFTGVSAASVTGVHVVISG